MRIVVYTVFFILLQHIVHAQTNTFLYKVVVVISLHSEILNESRDIYIQIPDSYKLDQEQKYTDIYILDR